MDKSNDLNLTIKQVIDKYNLLDNRYRSKSLGQHFLSDFSLLKKIVSCALPLDENNNNTDIIEIGPGPCGLTRAILDITINSNNNIICIEKDNNLKIVHDNLKNNSNRNISFIYEDALKVNLQSLTDKNIVIISNLPYNVGTQLLINWLLDLNRINKMVLMFQKEVVDRICAKVNTKEYGRLSIISQLLCNTEKVFDVSNRAFYPPPSVTSSIVKLTPKNIKINNISNLEVLTSNCFRHRRKTIYSILKTYYYNKNIENLDSILQKLNIDKMQRPETISPEQFLNLSEMLI